MNQTSSVGFGEAAQNVDRNPDRVMLGHHHARRESLGELVAERLSDQTLHREEDDALIILPEVEDTNGVGVLQAGGDLRLLKEAQQDQLVLFRPRIEHLDRDVLARTQMSRREHRAEAALPQLRFDPVTIGDDLPLSDRRRIDPRKTSDQRDGAVVRTEQIVRRHLALRAAPGADYGGVACHGQGTRRR